jgi:suppressor for copper-sensitivity B
VRKFNGLWKVGNAVTAFARRGPTLLAAVAWLLGAASPALAAASDWSKTDQAQVRLVAGIDGVGDRSSIPAGIQFRLQPGWKVYWRSPGDAGFPPSADWSRSGNVKAVSIAWPVPERFSIFDLETLGYHDEVVLPVEVELGEPGAAAALRAQINYLVCAEICIPQEAALALTIPVGPAAVSEQSHLLARYAARVPPKDGRHGLSLSFVSLTAGTSGFLLTLRAGSAAGFTAPDVFIEGPAGAYFNRPSVDLQDAGRTAEMKVGGGGVETGAFAGRPLRVTLVDGERSLETTLIPGPEALAADPPVSPQAAEGSGLPVILFFALLGGLILNLMPCVLPVLSIKLLAVAGYGGAEAWKIRIGFTAAAAGILVSFLAIAAGLIGFKAAGASIGWGIQFQQPVFLVLLTLVLTLFAANLFGLFEFRLPGPLADFAVRHGHGSSLAGHFLTGALATLLATPCTAPFLGTAVGFALSRGPLEIAVVMLAVGSGLALPYLVVAAVPELVSWLPRPGRWMVVLRRVLALALAATVAWLLSVLYSLIGTDAVAGVALLLVLIPAVLAARRLPDSRIGRHAGVIVAGLALAVVFVPVFRAEPPPPVSAKQGWVAFDEAEVRRLVAGGKVVLVDVTADWCITCQVNKRLVLDNAAVASALRNPDVVTMRADWTRPDPRIARYLASFGRYGIPFNVVYGPAAPEGIALPELLDTDAVLSALAAAGTDKVRVAR